MLGLKLNHVSKSGPWKELMDDQGIAPIMHPGHSQP